MYASLSTLVQGTACHQLFENQNRFLKEAYHLLIQEVHENPISCTKLEEFSLKKSSENVRKNLGNT